MPRRNDDDDDDRDEDAEDDDDGNSSKKRNRGEPTHALVAQIEGTLSLARNSQDPDTLSVGARSLRHFLECLTPTS